MHIVRRLVHERRLVSMDLVEINDSINSNEDKRRNYRGEDSLQNVSKSVGMGCDLMTSLFTKYFEL